jgi:hypothetical protein
VPEAMALIAERERAIRSIVTLEGVRAHAEDPYPAQHQLAMGVKRLQSEITNRYEIEALELGYKKLSATQGAQSKHEASLANTVVLESPPTSWSEIEIAFLSDERVEICVAGDRKTYNFGELGFEDRRNGNPTEAWTMLRKLAGSGGTETRPPAGKGRAMIQKRIEEIREKLRSLFGIQTDPIPFNGNTYQASFKTSRRPSFDT